jgi:hypothetical protein
MLLRVGLLVAFSIIIVGCSSMADKGMTIFADPAKYQYSTCEGLGRQRQTWTKKEQELRQLMDRAEQSAGGAVVNVLAYKGDHVAALEELQLIERAAHAKNCEGGARNWPSNSAIQ